jgi:hypothetical protein
LDKDIKDGAKQHIKDFNSFSGLRNAIAHHVWKAGTRVGSVKPLSISSRGGTKKIRGLTENERDYTLEDLLRAGNDLRVIRESFLNFLNSKGVFGVVGEERPN